MHVVLFVILSVVVIFGIHYYILSRIKNGYLQFSALILVIVLYQVVITWVMWYDFLYR